VQLSDQFCVLGYTHHVPHHVLGKTVWPHAFSWQILPTYTIRNNSPYILILKQ
jgi:hypothetical protein